MNSEKSFNNNLWEKMSVNKQLVLNTMSLAKRDLRTAKNVFQDNDFDWCLAISYNAMLQAGRALMFLKGFRPKGEYKHVAVIEFVKRFFGKHFEEQLLFEFDKTRKKRHISVYEQAEIISKEEAKNALNRAEKFVKKTEEIIEKELK